MKNKNQRIQMPVANTRDAMLILMGDFEISKDVLMKLLQMVVSEGSPRKALDILKSALLDGHEYDGLKEVLIRTVCGSGGIQGKLFVLANFPETEHRQRIVAGFAGSVCNSRVVLFEAHYDVKFSDIEFSALMKKACLGGRFSGKTCVQAFRAYSNRLDGALRDEVFSRATRSKHVHYLLMGGADSFSEEEFYGVLHGVCNNPQAAYDFIWWFVHHEKDTEMSDCALQKIIKSAITHILEKKLIGEWMKSSTIKD